MQEDPRYLQNQSRVVHRLYRRNRRFLRDSTILLLLCAAALIVAVLVDVFTHRGWGFALHDVWFGVGAVGFAGIFWLFGRAILSIILAISRRMYGPEPTEPRE